MLQDFVDGQPPLTTAVTKAVLWVVAALLAAFWLGVVAALRGWL